MKMKTLSMSYPKTPSMTAGMKPGFARKRRSKSVLKTSFASSDIPKIKMPKVSRGGSGVTRRGYAD